MGHNWGIKYKTLKHLEDNIKGNLDDFWYDEDDP